MKSKFRSKIEVDINTNCRCLAVCYNPGEDNFNEAIEAAYKHHQIKRGQITTIAIPER